MEIHILNVKGVYNARVCCTNTWPWQLALNTLPGIFPLKVSCRCGTHLSPITLQTIWGLIDFMSQEWKPVYTELNNSSIEMRHIIGPKKPGGGPSPKRSKSVCVKALEKIAAAPPENLFTDRSFHSHATKSMFMIHIHDLFSQQRKK